MPPETRTEPSGGLYFYDTIDGFLDCCLMDHEKNRAFV